MPAAWGSYVEELNFDEFLTAQSQSSWSRAVRYRIDFAKLQMRKAGQSYLEGRYLSSFGHLLAAATLNPQTFSSARCKSHGALSN
jgi:hypothetical protein